MAQTTDAARSKQAKADSGNNTPAATARVVAVQDDLVEIEAVDDGSGTPGHLVKNEVVYVLPDTWTPLANRSV